MLADVRVESRSLHDRYIPFPTSRSPPNWAKALAPKGTRLLSFSAPAVFGRRVHAGSRSVLLKSSPTKRRGSPANLAVAYEMQSPKFKAAG